MRLLSTEIQLLLIRICIGVDFFPYAIQHLFYSANPHEMTYFVGICMLLAGLGLTLGILTRLSAILSCIFLTSALFMGKHNQIGFFWYLPGGGGWEFLAIWSFLCATYILTGGGKISLDHYFYKYFF